MSQISVVLKTLSGDRAELEVDSDCDVMRLAQRVEMLWQIPQLCIKLVVGDTVLGSSSWGDYEKIRGHCQVGHSIEIALILSFDELQRKLQPVVHEVDNDAYWDHQDKMEALTALATLGPRANDDIITATVVHLSSQHLDVRRLTAEALAAIVAGSGSRRRIAVNAVKPYLENEGDDVRCAAIEALGQVADRCDQDVVAVVAAVLDDPNYEVKRAALKTLGAVAPLGGKDAISKITPYLESTEYGSLRHAAVDALEIIAVKGDESLIDLALKLAVNKDAGIKSTAVMLLGKTVHQGDASTVRMLAAFCEDRSWYVRRVAVEALASVAAGGDGCALAAVRKCLKDRDDSVRHAAAQAHAALESPA